jgi:glycosyltransferase involved in cell wall biosynthesis
MTSPKPKILYLTKYSRNAGSSRLRSFQFFPSLEKAGFDVEVSPLFSENYLVQLYARKSTVKEAAVGYTKRFLRLFSLRKYDKIVIEKELFPYLPAFAEQLLRLVGVRYVVDYDDAIFHNYDKSTNALIRFFLKNKIDTVMRNSYCVIAGNNYIRDKATLAGAHRIEVVPTVIDLARYERLQKDEINTNFVIGWMGSPTTFKYVQAIAPVLEELALNGAHIHIVGAKGDLGFTKNLHFISWEEATEVENIFAFDVGIMPLEDSPWEKGKCAYKLIQYMACGLPVVASPIGMNTEVVRADKNGYLANSHETWVNALNQYKDYPEMRKLHGESGFSVVLEKFTVKSQLKNIIKLLND